MKIDIKSLTVGLVLGISIAFSIAAKEGDLGKDGRFQMATGGDSSLFYVIDTRTGQVWSHDMNKKLK